MANKLFYGVSTTSGSDSPKQVTIFNPLEEQLTPGDLLAVYFAHGNEVGAPSMVVSNISNVDEEDEDTSLSEDAGIEIKTRDVEAEVDYMWQSGEMCIFVLTNEQFNSNIEQGYDSTTEDAGNNALHYMLIRGPRANSEWYGLTKLFTDEFSENRKYETFEDWLNVEDEDDKVTAATPYLVKELARRIFNITPEPEPEPGPEPQPPTPTTPLTIEYTPTAGLEDGYVIGTLTVGSTPYEIKIPTSSTGNIDHTSQLINDADIILKTNNEGQTYYIHNRASGDGNYFITNVVDNGNLFLQQLTDSQSSTLPTVGLYVAKPHIGSGAATISPLVEGQLDASPLLTRESNSTLLNSGFRTSPLRIYGTNIEFLPNDSGSSVFTIAKGTTNTGGVTSTTQIAAPNFREGGTLLRDKYSRKLKVILFRIGKGFKDIGPNNPWGFYHYYDGGWKVGRANSTSPASKSIEIASEGNTDHLGVYLTKGLEGYIPLGIIGYDLSYATNASGYKPEGQSSDPIYQNIWELYLTDKAVGAATVKYAIKNNVKRKVYCILDIQVLCVAN